MPRIEIPLTGWQQTPDERGGPPRIARLVNALLDDQGRISKSPGTTTISTTSPDGTITGPVAFGPTFEIFDGSTPAMQGFRLAAHDGDRWLYHSGKSDYLSPCEAPRLRAVFTEPSSQYCQPGVIDVGGGDYLVCAERLPLYASNPPTETFGAPYLSWALLSADDDLRAVATGDIEFVSGGTANARAFIVYAGTYAIGWKDSNAFRIRKWNATTRTFDVLADITAIAAGNKQIDAIYSASLNRLFVASSDGVGYWINGTTGAVLWYTTLSLAGTPVAGSIACCFDNTGRIYLTWQSSSTEWRAKTISVTDSGWTLAWAGAVIYTSPQTIYSGLFERKLRAEMCLDTTSNLIWAVAHGRTSATSTVLDESLLVYFSDTVAPVADNVARYRQCATKPIWDASNGAQYWAFVSHPTMTLRHWELLGAGYVTEAGTASKTAVCIGGDPGNAPDNTQVGACCQMARSSYLPPERAGLKRAGWIAALLVRRSSGASAPHNNVHVCLTVDGRTLSTATDNPCDLTQMALVQGESIVAGGIPIGYSTQPEPAGWLGPPPPPQLSLGTTTGLTIATGTYYYCTAYKYITATGAVMWSPVSDIASIYNPGDGTKYNIAMVFADTAIPATYKATVHLFRSVGGVYYECQPPAAPMSAAQLATGSAINDGNDDATFIVASPGILYTQGANGAVSGQLDHFGCPPCRCIWAGRSRVIAGGLAKENRVRWSNLIFPTEAVSWPEFASFYADVAAPVTAVASLDDAWIVFCEASIWVVTGQGPDSIGAGTFDDPQKLVSGIGCLTWRSLVATPEGLMFQSRDGQIYLLARGSYQVAPISQSIQDSLAVVSPSYDPGPPTVWVQGAAYDAYSREVWFSTHDSDWVLQRESMTWRQELSLLQGYQVVSVHSLDTPAYVGPVVIRATAGAYRPMRRSESNHYRDALGEWRAMSVMTSDIDLVHGRISRGFAKLALDYISGGTAALQAWVADLWYDGKPRHMAADATQTIAYSATTAATYGFHELEFDPARQKCNQIRIVLRETDTPDDFDLAWHILGLAVEVTQTKQRSTRYLTGTGRLT